MTGLTYTYKDLTLGVEDPVYMPAEDSELLAAAVQEHAFGKTLDLGTGSGLQGIVAAKKGCQVTFADADDAALQCAWSNALRNGVNGEFVRSDMFGSIRGKFNTIIFNPPYVPVDRGEKHDIAVDGGAGGRVLIDRFLAQYKNYVLFDHAVLLVESSLNDYERELRAGSAEVVGKMHRFFEDIVVLKLK